MGSQPFAFPPARNLLPRDRWTKVLDLASRWERTCASAAGPQGCSLNGCLFRRLDIGGFGSLWSVFTGKIRKAGGQVMVWKHESSQCIAKLGTFFWPKSIAFVPNPPRIISTKISGTSSAIMEVWDLDGGTHMHQLELGSDPIGLNVLRYRADTESLEMGLGHIRLGEVVAHDGQRISIADHSLGYGITDDGCWVTWRSVKLLWIPPEFRGSCSAISGSTVAIGSGTGRVSVIGFSAEDLLDGHGS